MFWHELMSQGVAKIAVLCMLCIFVLTPPRIAASTPVLEDLELVSVAQDLFRQQSRDIPRGAMEVRYIEGWGRVFYMRVVSRRTTLSEDMLSAFLVGGAVSQYARKSLDHIVVIGVMAFKDDEEIVLSSEGACCEQLYNNRITTDQFADNCLVTE